MFLMPLVYSPLMEKSPSSKDSQNHRIMEYLELERTHQDHQAQLFN